MLSQQIFELIDVVAQTGSFTAAAKKLHKVPSAISYSVKQIETELGVELFVRHHRSVSLTPAGKHFAAKARQFLSEMELMKRDTLRVANGWKPMLSIALDNIARTDSMHALIADFYRQFHDVELIIRIEVFNGVWEALAKGLSDIAIGATTANPVGGTFKYTNMGNIDWLFVVSAGHPLAKIMRPLSDDELRGFPSICLEDTSREIPKRITWLLTNQRRLVVPDWHSAINCFVEGLGIGYMPEHLAAPLIKSGQLVCKKLHKVKQPSACCLAWNDDQMSPALAWVLDYLGDSEQLHRQWLA
ncbi:LysR family transcriptional regulator [Shewanella sp. SR43-4]|jgi:DNA-binding transcriptional LysR family regulator|uniref:DNA-binding transcriptional activator PunR n=1 Tax=Shewanella sp. SR43-4 TaxID=2760942 RepID=UPI0015FDC34F|nr:DNA-binding transcriptional activator PunR [Shewanella sp. SR43-4]MBB1317906.1 LysR family transcriptional regulator [Shewanella sp. SR43-4]